MGPVTPVVRVTRVVLVDLAARGRADPAGRVTAVDPGDMNRVVAATVGTAAMAPAALVSQAGPVDPVGMTWWTRWIPVGMILGDPEGRLRAPNPVVRADPERLGVPNPVGRVDPGNREATDLSQGRELMVQTPMRLHLTVARPLLMPGLLHPTPADRRRDLTTRAVATCQEAPPAEAPRAVAIRRAEATHRAGATDGGAELYRRTDQKPVCLLTNLSYANL